MNEDITPVRDPVRPALWVKSCSYQRLTCGEADANGAGPEVCVLSGDQQGHHLDSKFSCTMYMNY